MKKNNELLPYLASLYVFCFSLITFVGLVFFILSTNGIDPSWANVGYFKSQRVIEETSLYLVTLSVFMIPIIFNKLRWFSLCCIPVGILLLMLWNISTKNTGILPYALVFIGLVLILMAVISCKKIDKIISGNKRKSK